jgi:hypothetical protein
MRAAEPHVPGIRSIVPPISCHVPIQTRRVPGGLRRCGSDCDLNSTVEFISQTSNTLYLRYSAQYIKS